MLKRYLPWFVLAFVVVACSKNSLETRPSIKIKNINSTEVFPNQQLVISLEFDDKEGDLGGGTVTHIRNRLNIKGFDPLFDKTDTVASPLPDFPKTTTGEIEVRIDYSHLDEDPGTPDLPGAPGIPVNDTMTFKLFVTDIAGNVSDTVVTDQIVERKR
jgi:hypothetical protein